MNKTPPHYKMTDEALKQLKKNSQFKDLIGCKFNRLTVVEFYSMASGGTHLWKCQCECGVLGTYRGGNLRSGHTQSCGCLRDEAIQTANKSHGLYGTKEYKTFYQAKARCNNSNNINYGGRGIKLMFNSVQEMIDAIGMAPSDKHSLDRINNNGNYEKGNVRWSTSTAQNRNKRGNRIIQYKGERKNLSEWCEFLCLNYKTVSTRINRGWSIERAFAK